MKFTIVLLSAVFCFFLYGFLDLYIARDTAFWFSLFLFLGLFAGMITPIKDSVEHKEPKYFSPETREKIRIKALEREQRKREQNERIALTHEKSLKRKERRLK